MTALGWGRRFLLCRPVHFTVAYEINPYMHVQVHPDPDLALAQHEALVANLRAAGAEVEFLEPVPGLPDLVFTANAGVVDAGVFVPSRFRHPERQGETVHDTAWFSARGFRVSPLPGDEPFEGAGDVLPFDAEPGAARGPVLVAGYRTRSAVGAQTSLGSMLRVPVRTVELTDERFYHVDLVFCPLDERRALVAPQGLDRYGCRVLSELVPEPVWLTDDEATSFCANSVVVGDVIVMPGCTPRLGRILEDAGLSVVVSPVGEFLKAGGGCRCLTLALDVDLSSAGRRGGAPVGGSVDESLVHELP
ncbi:MAG TPA: arginine deiminase-related protein [Acidimicrobiales bacterium]|nr:arginine deiminase-related protein [Acidimicrobiales bacterium]